MKKACILSIDGGGIRGIMPGVILTYLESKIIEKTGNNDSKIADYFDIIAGTSTGGILSCCLLKPDSSGRPQFSANDALNLYLSNGGKIFNLSLLQKIFNPFSVFRYKYSEKAIENILNKYFEDVKISQMVKDCMITAYDIEQRETKFFTKIDAINNNVKDFLLKDICRATSAAPTYFKPALIKSLFGNYKAFIDGGVFANNPAMCAYIEAMKTNFSKMGDKPNCPDTKDIIIISIGTGSVRTPYHYTNVKDNGVIGWSKPIIEILMSGNSETVSYMLKKIFTDLPDNYYRLEPELINADSKMDNASHSNILNLENDAKSYVTDNQNQLDHIVSLLIANN